MRIKGVFYLLATCLITVIYSCIDEDISPCPPNGVQLQYDYVLNMQYGNEFGRQVKDLKTFIFDEAGVLQDTLSPQIMGGELSDNWTRNVELAPGKYTLVSWANSVSCDQHFKITHNNDPLTPSSTGVVIGQTKLDDLRTFLRYNLDPADNDQATPQTDAFSDLFYGIAQNVEVKSMEMTTIHTSLIKDSKTIRVKVINLSAISKPAPVARQFTFKLTGRNAHYKWNNKTGESSYLVTYTPHTVAIDHDTLQADIKTLRLQPYDAGNLFSAPVLLEGSCGSLKFCKELDVVDLILKSKIPSRDSRGQIQKEAVGDTIWVYPTLEYLDRQDIFEITFVCSGGEEPDPGPGPSPDPDPDPSPDPGPDPGPAPDPSPDPGPSPDPDPTPDPDPDLNPKVVITIYVNGWKIQDIVPDL
ncbi:FimB/Mfa2 family fimbrial subunit [uncultured Parabacteroides sp.]|jgi:hypothetical protein|uniref:FimB/Mfa2 family fimbrial subunit n=1 Tax=uncultured Parabacteroides sp. TaxID=512312 RepID=UPI0025E07553|nr:FimB/Mfa2 family fimbrial subunit [uncultured Parabacteroides sp.]